MNYIRIQFNSLPASGTFISVKDAAKPNLNILEYFAPLSNGVGGYASIMTTTSGQAYAYYAALSRDYGGNGYTFTYQNNEVIISSNNPDSFFTITEDTGIVSTIKFPYTNPVKPSTELELSARTPISTEQQITFVNSPIHLRIQNAAADSKIERASVYLFIWNGSQSKPLDKPNLTLSKKKVSASDNYINFQIADYIKAFIENPPNAPNTNQPNFVFNEATPPAITGLGAFWQIVADITSDGVVTRTQYGSNFATLGYRWNYEQGAAGNNGLTASGSTGFLQSLDRYYNPKIAHYISQSFDLTKTVLEATAGNLIKTQPVQPPAAFLRCSRDSSLIVYINKLGLWDMFTPHGKITVPTEIGSEEQSRAFRDPSQIDNNYVHSKLRSALDVSQDYIINTGSLTESMVNQVEQIIYSPKVYLILFNGDVQENTTQGVTIDSTFITIDDTNITIDSATVNEELLGLFKTFQQIPVIPRDKSFTRKTRVNDKNKIDYNLKFGETTNKILDIR